MATIKFLNLELGGQKMKEMCLTILIVCSLAFNTDANAQEEDILPTLPGRIAYIGTDYNVYSLHPATGNLAHLTENGTRTQPYIWPTWSTDGRLAYFLSIATQDRVATEVYVSTDGTAEGNLLYNGDGSVFNYAYWSPQDCQEGENCRDLAVLLSTVDGLGVQLVRDSSDGAASQLIGRGGPFYYSWSPDGSQMLWQRNNQRMDIYDVNSNRIIDTLSQEPGVFSAPAWSPVDDRLLFGSLNEENQSTDLVIAANSETNTLAPRLDGVIYFSWSPDGDKVAYTSEQGPLIIVDAVTGETVADSAVSGVLAFFWSPDSQHIAYITLATPPSSINAKQTATQQTVVQEATGIAWSVMDVEETTTRRYGSFVPTREMLYLLVYFDQFSQSHRVWSPDSRYLLYSETTANGRASINILDTTQSNIVPFSIAEGLIGVWSFS
jgi:TolB protein